MDSIPLLDEKEFVLVPVPMVRRRQVIQLVGNLLQSHRRMCGLYLQHTLALRWADPFRGPYAVVLLQLIQMSGDAALDGHLRRADEERADGSIWRGQHFRI
jgi:hypothetical protein